MDAFGLEELTVAGGESETECRVDEMDPVSSKYSAEEIKATLSLS